MAVYKIPGRNVLRHKDIAPGRKWDISDTFWKIDLKEFSEYQDSLIPKQV